MLQERVAVADDFRTEAREWLAANFPPSLAGKAPGMGGEEPDGEDFHRWRAAICGRGFGTPMWPIEYGGAGLSRAEAQVLREEMRRIGAWNPIATGMGVRMLGPTLMEYGNEAQKLQHLPRVAAGETRWCQGYSEPGAGSDLASLQTSAIDHGDHYLVNGQKIWTSGANHADWCFCLVRTDKTSKHEGISFLLIDMRTPGVSVKPIRLISGNSPFCETFFVDVKVPKENLVGELNKGWTIAKRLLQFERQRNEDAPIRQSDNRKLADIAREYLGVDDQGRVADADLRARIIAYEGRQKAFALTMTRAAAEAGGAGPTAAGSILKNVSSTLSQERAELLMEIMGSQGLGWEGESYSKAERDATREWLSGKATTIYAGSYEIQNNIIAKRVLGLLDHQ